MFIKKSLVMNEISIIIVEDEAVTAMYMGKFFPAAATMSLHAYQPVKKR